MLYTEVVIVLWRVENKCLKILTENWVLSSPRWDESTSLHTTIWLCGSALSKDVFEYHLYHNHISSIENNDSQLPSH